MGRTPDHWIICPREAGGCGRKVGLQKRFDMQSKTEEQPWVVARHKVSADPGAKVCNYSRSRVASDEVLSRDRPSPTTTVT